MLGIVFSSFSPLLIFTVYGTSMTPTLMPKQKVLVWKYGIIKKNDIVVCKKPQMKKLLVKRVKKIKQIRNHQSSMNTEVYFIQGDNKNESTDSRHFGWVSKKSIIGKVIYHLP